MNYAITFQMYENGKFKVKFRIVNFKLKKGYFKWVLKLIKIQNHIRRLGKILYKKEKALTYRNKNTLDISK